jgi:hypothetical protein
VCRAAVDAQCDFAEVCSGNNATCPADKTAPDGQSCGSSGEACASGTCTSLNLQCQSAGASMNLTTACGQRDDTSCVVTCKSPNVTYVSCPSHPMCPWLTAGRNQCVVLQTPLVDGSPCGERVDPSGAIGQSLMEPRLWWTLLQPDLPSRVVGGHIRLVVHFQSADLDPGNHCRRSDREYRYRLALRGTQTSYLPCMLCSSLLGPAGDLPDHPRHHPVCPRPQSRSGGSSSRRKPIIPTTSSTANASKRL